jgi:hypothetical protein
MDMLRRILGVSLFMLTVSAPVFAVGEADSPEDYCKDEARDAGITDKAELKAYIADCVQQIKEEMEEDKLLESDSNLRQRMDRGAQEEPEDIESKTPARR